MGIGIIEFPVKRSGTVGVIFRSGIRTVGVFLGIIILGFTRLGTRVRCLGVRAGVGREVLGIVVKGLGIGIKRHGE